MEKTRAMQLLYSAIPDPHQIGNLDFGNPGYVYFVWRGTEYRYSFKSFEVWEKDGLKVIRSNSAILITELIKRQLKK